MDWIDTHSRWTIDDALVGHTVTMETHSGSREAVVIGVGQNGMLRVVDRMGTIWIGNTWEESE